MRIRTPVGRSSGMATMRTPKRRTYADGCAAHALDLIGERWACLVVRELLLGPKRFTDLRAGIPHLRARTCSPSACASWRGLGWCAAASFPAGGFQYLRADRLGYGARAGHHRSRPLGRPLPIAAPQRRTWRRFP